MITVSQVCKKIGIEPNKHMMWSVGAIMQAKYRQHFGHQPMKDNRPKTNGPGEHCMALYPPDWENLIASELRKHNYIQTRQIDMFPEDDPEEDDE